MQRCEKVVLSLAVGIALFTGAGCRRSVRITQPANNANLQGNVTLALEFDNSADKQNYTATLNGQDVKPLFPAVGGAIGTSTTVSSAPPLQPGANTFSVYASMPGGSGWTYNVYNATVSFNWTPAALPALTLTPSSPFFNAGAVQTMTVGLPAAPTVPLTVNIASANPAVASVPNTVSVVGTSAQFAVQGGLAGATAVTVSAQGFQSATATATVNPVLSGLQPAAGCSGLPIAISGNGFLPNSTVSFGGTAASVMFGSASSLTATVPVVGPGSAPVTVTSGGRTSNAVAFTVNRFAYRSSNQDIQSLNFNSAATPAVLATLPATLSPGGLTTVVGLASNGANVLLRASSNDIQSFTVSSSGSPTLVSTVASVLSGTGSAVAARGTTVVRTTDTGIQLFQLNAGNALQTRGTRTGALSASGVGADLAGTVALRAYNGGVEFYDISNLSSPSLLANVGGSLSATGVALKVASAGNVAVRAHASGIEVYTMAGRTLAGSFNNAALSSTGVAVDVNPAGTRAVRAYNLGLEIYDITTAASPVRIGSFNGNPASPSTTGVSVWMSGNLVFRGTNQMVEVYDISNPAIIVRLGQLGVTVSTTGNALAGCP